MIFPFLFITIACGAVSGFHCLVSSGTSSKQIESEPDARFVGYGSMLTEGFLATLVILACGAGLGLGVMAEGKTVVGEAAWAERYASWGAAKGLGAKVGAFVDGSANFLMAIGLSTGVAVALMGVLVASFAGTTLDTACRLQRHVIQEIGRTLSPEKEGLLAFLRNKHGATIFAVLLAGAMAAAPPSGEAWAIENAGKGGLLLWPLFGATNQLLAGLSFLVITFYLWRRGKPVWFLVLPMIFMLITPVWAMYHQLFTNPGWLVGETPDYLLGGIGLATIALEIWMLVEAFRLFPKAKGVLEADLAEGDVLVASGIDGLGNRSSRWLGGCLRGAQGSSFGKRRKRRLERAERDLRVKAAAGGFAPKKWDEPGSRNDESGKDGDENESPEEEEPDSEGSEEKETGLNALARSP